MITLSIAVCEDDKRDAELLTGLIEQSGISAKTEVFTSGETLLSKFRPGRFDLMFLDIYTSGISGIETAKGIREQDGSALLVFTTSSPDHTYESYSLKAVRYLLKPVQPADVREVMKLAEVIRKNRQSVTLLSDGSPLELPLDSILYFEQEAHNVVVHTVSGDVPVSRTVGMDAIEKMLPAPPFLRCHKSFIVNFGHVENVGRDFMMRGGGIAYIRRGDVSRCAAAFQGWLMDGGDAR